MKKYIVSVRTAHPLHLEIIELDVEDEEVN